MRWTVNLKIAVANLRATRVRTALTILGIVIGVASVTVILALGQGAKNMISSQTSQLGNNFISVRPGSATRDHNGNITNYNFLAALGASTLTENDASTVAKTNGVTSVAPFMFVTGSITSSNQHASGASIIATSNQCATVLGFNMRAGAFLSDTTNRQTVVLGQDLALNLLGSDVAIGQTISIRGKDFTVVGILNHYNSSATVSNLIDLNNAAFVPLDAGKAFNQGIAQIQQINARAKDNATAKTAATAVQKRILDNHGGEQDFTVLRPGETVQITDSLFKVLTEVIGAIASISILVGGIGVMNIMLVSVTERTREIGIRKAVGATNHQILWQFLTEALLMTILGGVVGVGGGYLLAFIAGTFLGFMPGISVGIIVIATTVSLGVGLLFGAWPAIKAARKDPIEALRYFQ